MARFTYNGDHEEVTTWGVTFPRGVPVEVTEPTLLRKLPGNSEFSLVPEPQPEPKQDEQEDGGETVESLRAKLDALGIEYDARWGFKRLAALHEGVAVALRCRLAGQYLAGKLAHVFVASDAAAAVRSLRHHRGKRRGGRDTSANGEPFRRTLFNVVNLDHVLPAFLAHPSRA